MAKPAGWRKEPARHALAAKGIKTGNVHGGNAMSGPAQSITRREQPVRISMEDVKEASRKGDKHFFDADTIRFFDSRVGPNAWQVGDIAYFITSEQFHSPHGPSGARLYTVRQINLDTGNIDTIGEFNKMTESEAKQALERILKQG